MEKKKRKKMGEQQQDSSQKKKKVKGKKGCQKGRRDWLDWKEQESKKKKGREKWRKGMGGVWEIKRKELEWRESKRAWEWWLRQVIGWEGVTMESEKEGGMRKRQERLDQMRELKEEAEREWVREW